MSNVPAVQGASPATIDAAYAQHVVEVTAHRLARSSLLPDSLTVRNGQRRPVEDIEVDLQVIGQTTIDLGIPFNLQTLQKMPVIKGTVDIMAQLLLGIAATRGHDAWIEESTMQKATACLVNGRTGRKHSVTYTLEEAAKTPQYKTNPCWTTNPGDMLVARAVRRVINRGAPDVRLAFPKAFGDEDDGATDPEQDASADYQPAPALSSGAPATPPATDKQRSTLMEAIQALTTEERGELVRRWTAAELPILRSPEFDVTDAFDASLLILGVKGYIAAADDRGDEQSPLTTSPGGKSPAEGNQPLAQSGTSVGAATPDAPTDDRARPLPQAIAMAAQDAGVDHHHVIMAVTGGAKASAKDVDTEEGQLTLQAIAAIGRGEYTVVEKDGRWVFTEPRERLWDAADLGRPFED